MPAIEFGKNPKYVEGSKEHKKFITGTIRATKEPKEYVIKKEAKPDSNGEKQQDIKYHRHYLEMEDEKYPGLSKPTFVSKGLVRISRFANDSGKVSWSVSFRPEKEEQDAINRIQNDLVQVVAANPDFYGLKTDEEGEEGEEGNKASPEEMAKNLVRLAKQRITNILKYPKIKNTKKEDKTKPPFVSLRIKDPSSFDAGTIFNVIQIKDGKREVKDLDEVVDEMLADQGLTKKKPTANNPSEKEAGYKQLKDKTFEAYRYWLVRDICTTSGVSPQVFAEKIVMVAPPVAGGEIDDDIDDYSEIDTEVLESVSRYLQDLAVKKANKGTDGSGLASSNAPTNSTSNAADGASNPPSYGDVQTERDLDSIVEGKDVKKSFASKLGGAGKKATTTNTLKFSSASPPPTDEAGEEAPADDMNNLSTPVIRAKRPLVVSVNHTSRAELESYMNGGMPE